MGERYTPPPLPPFLIPIGTWSSSATAGAWNGNPLFFLRTLILPLRSSIISKSSTLHRLHRYVHDDDDLNKYFAAFHLHDTLPAAVMIDDFGHLFDQRICQDRYANSRGRELAMVRTLALCHNAISYANKHGGPCTLLLSDTHHGDSPRLLFIYKRWISTVVTVHGDESGSFSLKATRDLSTCVSRTTTAVYSIALQSLFLERIVEEGDLKK